MAGCNLIIISGINGSFEEFETFFEESVVVKPKHKLRYDRKISFVDNMTNMRNIINSHEDQVPNILLGWSIGAAAAAFLSDCISVKTCIMINSFYSRQEILERRNIKCDEQVCLESSYKFAPIYVIIRGELDDKIPPEQSDKIFAMYSSTNREMHSFPLAKHNISSFPIEDITKIINDKIQ